MPRKHDDSGFLGKAPHEVPRNTVSHWNRYLARDPPSYDSGTLLSEADAKTMMDKIEARRKWFKAIANEMASNSRVTVTAEDIAESDDTLRGALSTWILKRGPVDYNKFQSAYFSLMRDHLFVDPDFAAGETQVVRQQRLMAMYRRIHEETWGQDWAAGIVRQPNGGEAAAEGTRRVREEYEKGTIAGDDPKAFRDKYRFLPYRFLPHGTNLRNMWAAMQREAHKTCPRDYIKLKTAFQQYKDFNTNWKDILLAYRADKIKEWNQDHGIGPHESVDWTTYKKGTIAGDNPKVFCDKYCFRPHGETETDFRNIWAAMERAANKTCPGDPSQMKATFQQYKNVNTNWKDILLAHRNEKIKEWNQDANMFRDKYGFYPHGETETELIRIWTKMERAAHKMCPSSRDHIKLKAAFQQYKDANTNWKDILLAYRADRIKEWNTGLVNTMTTGVDENTMAAGADEDIEQCKLIRQLHEDVVDWQSQRCISSIPCRHSLDEEERRLGCRLQLSLIHI